MVYILYSTSAYGVRRRRRPTARGFLPSARDLQPSASSQRRICHFLPCRELPRRISGPQKMMCQPYGSSNNQRRQHCFRRPHRTPRHLPNPMRQQRHCAPWRQQQRESDTVKEGGIRTPKYPEAPNQESKAPLHLDTKLRLVVIELDAGFSRMSQRKKRTRKTMEA